MSTDGGSPDGEAVGVQNDAYVMKSFKASTYRNIFKKYIEDELKAIETTGWQTGQKIDSERVSRMELLRYQRQFIKGLLDFPEKIIGMDLTKELQEQEQINAREMQKMMGM